MTVYREPDSRTVVVWLGTGDVVIGPLMHPTKPDEQLGVALFPINRGIGAGQEVNDSSVDIHELGGMHTPRIEIYLPSLEACRGALVLADALRAAVENIGSRINEERKEHGRYELRSED